MYNFLTVNEGRNERSNEMAATRYIAKTTDGTIKAFENVDSPFQVTLPWEMKLVATMASDPNGTVRSYRTSRVGRGMVSVSIGKARDAQSLLVELKARAAKNGDAVTGAPGIAGYQRAANAASSAMRARSVEAAQYYSALATLTARGEL